MVSGEREIEVIVAEQVAGGGAVYIVDAAEQDGGFIDRRRHRDWI
jgi:hypothetical protein